jgi:hypothetical protein
MKQSRVSMFVLVFNISVTAVLADVVQESGDFVVEVARLKNLVLAKDSGLYVPPTSPQQDSFASMVENLFAGEIAAADDMASLLGYEVVEFTDTNSWLVLHGLREVLQGGEQTRGWGSYFVNLSSEVADLIEVPHPRFDSYSWDIGARIVVDSRAKAFLMAGAHRNANGSGTADVAHLTNTIFHVAHQAWNGEVGGNTAWQIHGFNIDNHSAFPANTDAVLSNGDGGISGEIMNLDGLFHTNGFLSHVYNTLPANSTENLQVNGEIDGTVFSSLGAGTNVQGIHSRSLGGIFVHVELEQSIRFSSTNRVSVAALVSDTIRTSSRVAPEITGFNPMVSTSIAMQVESLVRDRVYVVRECTNLAAQVWSTNMVFSASNASTSLAVAVDSEWDRGFFRVTLEQAGY